MTRLWTVSGMVLVATVAATVAAAAPDRKPPRVVAATMLDTDRNFRADRLRLTYSERVRHVRDRDGRYPFVVSGYRIRSVGAASGKALVLVLFEASQPDAAAAPAIRYRRTGAQPVRDRAGNQALAQRFGRAKPHGRTPTTPPPTPTSPSPPTPLDTDGDRTPDAQDCAPRDAAIHPGAADLPDLGFVDANCDGIDGTEEDAVFASPNGNDQNPGTKTRPKRQIQKAVDAAVTGKKRYVLAAFGTFGRVELASGVSIYGGYDASSWVRRDRFPDGLTLITGSPEGVLATGVKDVILQHVGIRGAAGSGSTYGLRAVGGAAVTLQRVALGAGDGAPGSNGANGARGRAGGAGEDGDSGSCDATVEALAVGGKGGASPAGRRGGVGGAGVNDLNGRTGLDGLIGTPGGPGGSKGNPGKPGGRGATGENGAPSPGGAGATSAPLSAAEDWRGRRGSAGAAGLPGNGGGGGGGGGAQVGLTADNGRGNAGGGGGGGAAGGAGGSGGNPGGGSFGIWLFDSAIVVEGSTVTAGKGGAGGRGGDGGIGGAGGRGGKGGTFCTSEIGAGGDGGLGGAGGRGGGGGGGAGGPSVGIVKAGASTATLKGSKLTIGQPGAGGAGGGGGPGGAGRAGATGPAQAVYPG